MAFGPLRQLLERGANAVGGVGHAAALPDGAVEGDVDPALGPRHVLRRRPAVGQQRRVWGVRNDDDAVEAQWLRRCKVEGGLLGSVVEPVWGARVEPHDVALERHEQPGHSHHLE
eukprot:scaffold9331_cov116-Isochrysis_galbana.AAC.11